MTRATGCPLLTTGFHESQLCWLGGQGETRSHTMFRISSLGGRTHEQHQRTS
jgi:hypothetical protein